MAPPSKSFTVIPDGDVDPDSALTTTLAVAWRDNDQFLEEWLGKDYTAAQNHDHDGINSKTVTGTLSLVEEKTITGNTGLVTFAGLDGDTDDAYLLVGYIHHVNALVIIKDFILRPNGVNTNQTTAGNNVPGGVGGTRLVLAAIDNDGTGGEVTFWAFFGATKVVNAIARERIGLVQTTNTGGGAGNPYTVELWQLRWNETTVNITSLEVQSIRDDTGAQVTAIGDGSSIALYKLKA